MSNILPPAVYEIRDKILGCVEPEKIYLFGSYAYGTPRPDSDFDFYVVVPDSHSSSLRETKDLIYKKIDEYRKTVDYISVDVIVHTEFYFGELKPLPTLVRKIVREGVLLYDRR
ncbi:MAG: nucleotidyltransferase domain-containing protein [Planctomycetaceae bacterium]|jgi:predicted nucleotidyltransferase|nr:nucleotidyltransferase domain-containing protein [Planctomycetaceae bacterium]